MTAASQNAAIYTALSGSAKRYVEQTGQSTPGVPTSFALVNSKVWFEWS